MKRFFLIIAAIATCATVAMAQPAKRRTTSGTATQRPTTGEAKPAAGSDRAALMFPTSDGMPEDVSWRRDLYRILDLTQDKNAPLYYPVTPIGTQCNLFTYIFRLVLTGRVPAYDYKMTGVESFAAKDKIKVKDFLEQYSIYFEENNGKITVADADVPSELVKRYYVKESMYLDQRTGTTHTKVTALCPVMLEGGEFGDEATPKPLFWMKYDDVAPYLSKLPVMASDLNNVTNMTADDYFTLNRYQGKIYKTNNMQGKTLSEYCPDSTSMANEQKRIEKQLSDFEDHLWGHAEAVADSTDSVAVADAKPAKKAKKGKSETTSTKSRRSSQSQKQESAATESSSAPRVSARRQRR